MQLAGIVRSDTGHTKPQPTSVIAIPLRSVFLSETDFFERPSQIWGGGHCQHSYRRGLAYLSIVKNLNNHKIVNYAFSSRIDTV